MREGKEPKPWQTLVKAEWAFRQVESSGLGGFCVDQGMSTLHNLALSLTQRQDGRAVGFFFFLRKKGFCLFVSPLAKLWNTCRGAALVMVNGREANGCI